MTAFYGFDHKIKTAELKMALSPVWKLETPMILLCISGLLIFR